MPELRCCKCNYLVGTTLNGRSARVVCPNARCKAGLLLYRCFSCMKVSVLEAASLPQGCPRCFTRLHSELPLPLRAYNPDTPKVKIFESFPAWCARMEDLLGEGTWYAVGGFAAYHRIIKHRDSDDSYLQEKKPLLFPGDLEIEVTEAAAEKYYKKYTQTYFQMDRKTLLVTLFPQPKATFEDRVLQTDTSNVCRMFIPQFIIEMYKRANDPTKAEKRKLRVRLLTLVVKGKRVDSKNEGELPPMVGASMLGAFNMSNPLANLKKVNPNKTT